MGHRLQRNYLGEFRESKVRPRHSAMGGRRVELLAEGRLGHLRILRRGDPEQRAAHDSPGYLPELSLLLGHAGLFEG